MNERMNERTNETVQQDSLTRQFNKTVLAVRQVDLQDSSSSLLTSCSTYKLLSKSNDYQSKDKIVQQDSSTRQLNKTVHDRSQISWLEDRNARARQRTHVRLSSAPGIWAHASAPGICIEARGTHRSRASTCTQRQNDRQRPRAAMYTWATCISPWHMHTECEHPLSGWSTSSLSSASKTWIARSGGLQLDFAAEARSRTT